MNRNALRTLTLRISLLATLPCLGVVIPALTASARTWNVDQRGTADATHIQAAIDSAKTGDVIQVAPGRYSEAINFNGKEIAVVSTAGAAATILDGRALRTAIVTFESGETQASVLRGFTLTNGRGTPFPSDRDEPRGGALFCPNGSPRIVDCYFIENSAALGGAVFVGSPFTPFNVGPTIQDCVFERNSSARNGGAIDISSATLQIGFCTFRNNSTHAGDGGAINVRLRDGEVTISHCSFSDNRAHDKGGGIHAYTGSIPSPTTRVFISECSFVNNHAAAADGLHSFGAGGAVYAEQTSGAITHNTFILNTAGGRLECNGGAIGFSGETPYLDVSRNLIALHTDCAFTCISPSKAKFESNLVWDATPAILGSPGASCPQSWTSQILIADPLFCNPGSGDYGLAYGSPALGHPRYGSDSAPSCEAVSVHRLSWSRLKRLPRE